MKKVLIVTDLFCASPRIPGLCKYLGEFGWEATILTTSLSDTRKGRLVVPPNTRIIEVPYKNIAKFWKGMIGIKHNESVLAPLEQKNSFTKNSLRDSFLFHLFILGGTILAYPDEMRSWRIPAIKAGKALLDREKFDAVISSSSPITSHRIAKDLTKYSETPWIADLRDLWTQHHNYLYPLRKFIETRLEKKTLSQAQILSTVSESLLLKLQSRYPSKNIKVLTNGFDPELVNEPMGPLTKEFTITYTGLTYRVRHNPGRLFQALHELITEGRIDANKVLVRFYGVTQKCIMQYAKLYGVEDIVMQFGPVSRDAALARQRESQLLLMHGWEDEYETGVLPIKMFEYFAARRPILATGGTSQEQFRTILQTTRAGQHAIEISSIKTILCNYYQSYIETGAVTYEGIPAEMDKYSHRNMAKKFSLVLNEAVSKTGI